VIVNPAGQKQVQHRAQSITVGGGAIEDVKVLWRCESLGSPEQMIGFVKRRGAFEINRHQTALGSDHDVFRFAIPPGPPGSMYLGEEVGKLNPKM